jgi:hypothetical protein
MAYREGVKNQELKNFLNGSEIFWNISADVGWGCVNHWADVMLVQYLLATALDWRDSGFKIDGSFGPKTSKLLKAVQKDLLKICGESGNADGKVDSVDGTKRRSTNSKTTYTILSLNCELKYRQPSLYADITGDYRLPAALRAELCKVVVGDGVIVT